MNTHQPLTKKPPSPKSLLNCSFNQDQSCFAVCHENGFKVFNTDPMELKVERWFSNGSSQEGTSIGNIAILYRTNYLALIGGGHNPKYPINKVIIWDDLKQKQSLSLEFMNPVLNVMLSRTRIIVLVYNKAYVYGFNSPPKLITTIETFSNEFGVCDYHDNIGSISTTNGTSNPTGSSLLAIPGKAVGQIQVVDISTKNKVTLVKAHKSKLQKVALNQQNTMVASASIAGTMIRIHSTTTGSLLFEFRRGMDTALVTALKFSPSGTNLAVLSNKGTLHIFHVDHENTNINNKHLLNNISVLPKYFHSTWSFCSARLTDQNDKDINTDAEIGWVNDTSLVLVYKKKSKWEKYVIQEQSSLSSDNKSMETKYSLVREGWRRLL
ncbi:Phosphatidylinositol 3,5-bisphosphate-binding protein [Komagataella phaffii CBS 7435]|uniref:Phosphatidylinositol 3,5-bisphosphate-binding protein n=2 Tax=Komagataella phaffii TaxID=460519 RepID=C4QXQ6_KOMPG|nr:Phosphatidylinositol 3,5-bisphosphate-binding protein [Komagataella phaffii GS115]AOA61256.1 GQ67_01984T0 [Komagataella phaffii]KAI0464597.1 hypothetical protein LJB42_002216 [Komagataella kurtzmanii]CAH2446846.1 Phosphatidylinositol 3,5-bisphosphate-binding protein [Komagataella phaffii CBS 7435]AOA66603.1 GQ68_01999T0 [Komagataella phaffii GS115]CAY68029.1 Phosphatidylinositol 3,5-bisphosphate-binding protein [Komagataella phaffii GS115]